MSTVLQRLSDSNKKAIVSLACMIEAQGKGGRFRSNDPEVDIIIRECFDDSWRGNWDNNYKHNYFGQAVLYAINNQRECFQIVAALDDETKYAFKNMMIDIIGDNAMMVLAAAYVYKEIGMPTYVAPQREESTRQERNEQEEGDAGNIEDPFYILTNVGAVRGENDKVFTLVNPDTSEEVSVGANYDYWLSEGICPVNGIVGYVDPEKSIQTEEGKLCYLVCPGNLVVPVLEWGLKKLDEWDYEEKSQHVEMLACDKNGKLCQELRAMKKPSRPATQETEMRPSDQQVVKYTATFFQRIEGGRVLSARPNHRDIRLTYTKRGSELKLEILGVTQPRYARFKNDNGRILSYEDTTRPYTYYEVETEPEHNTIVRVSIFQKNASFEDLEYRYSIDESHA